MMPQGKSEAVVGAFQVDDGWKTTSDGGGQRGRTSELDALLETVKGNAQYHGQFIGVARYGKAETAKGALSALRARLGRPDASGFTFETRFHQASGQFAIVAKYEPGVVTEEGKTKHEKEKAERKVAEKAARIKREAKKAEGEGGTDSVTKYVETEEVAA